MCALDIMVSLTLKDAFLARIEEKRRVIEYSDERSKQRSCRLFDTAVVHMVPRISREVSDKNYRGILYKDNGILKVAKALCLSRGLREDEIENPSECLIMALRINLSRPTKAFSRIIKEGSVVLGGDTKENLLRLEAKLQIMERTSNNAALIQTFLSKTEVRTMTEYELQGISEQSSNLAERCADKQYVVYDHILPFDLIKSILINFGIGPLRAILTLGVVEYFRGADCWDTDIKQTLNTLAHFGEERSDRLVNAAAVFSVLKGRYGNKKEWGMMFSSLLIEENIELMWDKLLILYIFEYDHFENVFLCGLASFFRGVFVVLFAKLYFTDARLLTSAVNDFLGDPHMIIGSEDETSEGHVMRRGILKRKDQMEFLFLITRRQFDFLSEILHSMDAGKIFNEKKYRPWAKWEILQLLVNLMSPSTDIDLNFEFDGSFPIPRHLQSKYEELADDRPELLGRRVRDEIAEWIESKVNGGGDAQEITHTKLPD